MSHQEKGVSGGEAGKEVVLCLARSVHRQVTVAVAWVSLAATLVTIVVKGFKFFSVKRIWAMTQITFIVAEN